MMNWKSLILGAALALAGCASTPEPLAQPKTQAVNARPALWVVKDADTTIYLFGTIHLLKPDVRWFEGRVRKAFDSSQEVVLEVVSRDDPDRQAKLMQRALRPDGPTISSRLPEPARTRFLDALASNNLPVPVFDRTKPWFATITLSVLPLHRYGYDPNSGADHQIELAAVADGKTLTGLETADQQIGFFDDLPDDLQIALLNETLDELPKLQDMIEKMMAAWAKGEPRTLASLLNESVETNPELEKRLLTDRNARWADWIKARLEKPGTVFMAVGAGHLAGEKSVQAMLRQRGLVAAQLPNRAR